MTTIGYHIVKSGYGLWLPGDERGSWSEAWDEQIGFVEPHTLHAGDPVRGRMAAERMAHAPVRFSAAMIAAIAAALEQCASESDWRVAALALEPTHMHLALTCTVRDIDGVVKWLSQRTTRRVHEDTAHVGPVWCKGRWRQFIYEPGHWDRVIAYIEAHNIRRGLPARPYPWVGI